MSLALVIAIGVNDQGEGELLGFGLGASETAAFSRKDIGTVCQEFLRLLVQRGL